MAIATAVQTNLSHGGAISPPVDIAPSAIATIALGATPTIVAIFRCAGFGKTKFVITNTGANPLSDLAFFFAASSQGASVLAIAVNVNAAAALAAGQSAAVDVDLEGRVNRVDVKAVAPLGSSVQIDGIGAPSEVPRDW